MGKGDQKSRRGKVTAGSYGKKRPRKSASVNNIPVKVLDGDDKKAPKAKVKKEVGQPTEKTENANVEKKPNSAPKTKKTEE